MDRGEESGIPEPFFRELQVQFLVHELKDPLAIIEAGVRSLLEKRGKLGPLTPRQEKTLKRVLRGALKGRSMLNNLLEIGRSEAGQITGGSFCPAKTVYADLLASIETIEGELFEQVSELMTEEAVLNFLKQAGISLSIASGMDAIEIIQKLVDKFIQPRELLLGKICKRPFVDGCLEGFGVHGMGSEHHRGNTFIYCLH